MSSPFGSTWPQQNCAKESSRCGKSDFACCCILNAMTFCACMTVHVRINSAKSRSAIQIHYGGKWGKPLTRPEYRLKCFPRTICTNTILLKLM